MYREKAKSSSKITVAGTEHTRHYIKHYIRIISEIPTDMGQCLLNKGFAILPSHRVSKKKKKFPMFKSALNFIWTKTHNCPPK